MVDPLGVGPLVGVEVDDDRACVRANLASERIRIGFKREHCAVCADNFVFVDGTFAELGNEEFPDSGRAARAHGIDAAIPPIKVADEADAASAGRPDGKMHASDAFQCLQMRAEFFVRVVVAAFSHEVQIKFAEKIGKGIGIQGFDSFAIDRAIANAVVRRSGRTLMRIRQRGFKKTFRSQLVGRDGGG